MRASTNACASDGSLSVTTLIGYSVPCPPGAVISMPAENRSARSEACPALCSLRIAAAKCTSVNISSTESGQQRLAAAVDNLRAFRACDVRTERLDAPVTRSEEHTSELQSPM